MIFGLYGHGLLAEDATVHDNGVPSFRGVSLAYNGRDKAEVDAVLAEAEAAGAEIIKNAEEVFWGGYSGYFADPDGHLWEVAYNPGFPIADDGSISLPDGVKFSPTMSSRHKPGPRIFRRQVVPGSSPG